MQRGDFKVPGIEYPLRPCVELSHDWVFAHRRMARSWLSNKDSDSESIVNLPHCWNSRDAFQEGVSYYRGSGSYRKTFTFPEELRGLAGGRWYVESEGFYGTGDLWVNGHRLTAIDGQYIGLSVDVNEHLCPDWDNTIGVRLTNKCTRNVLPGIDMPDFLLYGGLSGKVRLVYRPELHLGPIHINVAPEDPDMDAWHVTVCFSLANDSSEARQCSAHWTIEELQGDVIASADCGETVLEPASERSAMETTLTLKGAKAWSPAQPHLYRLTGQLLEEGVQVDSARLSFGCRNAEFLKGGGFAINGRKIELRGCNRHESMPGFGRALPEGFHRKDAECIKELGLNFVRLSHYPQHPAFLDACDELGVMVYPEIATWKSVRGGGRWLHAACRQMRDMVLRDRHHPSVILWGMGNESRSRRAYLKLREIVRELDPCRPVTYAENHLYRARRKKTLGIPDVWGVNYELDAVQEGRRSCSLENVLISECANYPHTCRGDLSEEFRQVSLIADELDKIAGSDGVSGFALWCFNDYATLRKSRFLRYSGIVDAWRLPKMSGAFLQAKFKQEPFIKVFVDWSSPEDQSRKDDDARTVYVFTNCDTVEILLNGRTVVSEPGKTVLTVDVQFEAGVLVARGMRDDVAVSDRIESWSRAERIAVLPEQFEASCGNRDTVGIMVRVVDGAGRHVRCFSGVLQVSVNGPCIVKSYTENGEVLLAGGEGRSFVEGTGVAGDVSVTVAGRDLTYGSASLVFK
ncbi:MAG: glycoside hydrolase family 2 TIM barrel-domain containing protein [Kiritimatiellia bacterium]|jgi:beta-galactosidase|nr:glycoside hydrolase family 2 TIM barrel-domain containing protein [Kiritimatiellia bacterium]